MRRYGAPCDDPTFISGNPSLLLVVVGLSIAFTLVAVFCCGRCRSTYRRRYSYRPQELLLAREEAALHCIEKIIKFIVYTEQLRKTEKFKNVYGADETGIWLNPTGGLCVEQIGAKDVTILSSGNTWDAFKAHTSEDTKKVLKALKLHSSVIPGGCTRFIQPADVSWNKPFKARFQALYDQWMLDGVHETTAAGNPKPPPPEQYLEWVLEAWYDGTRREFRIGRRKSQSV